MSESKYSDVLADWLQQLGYTHCFFVAGGNIMHLLESCSQRMTCIPVMHEVASCIAAEYFNEVHLGGKAFALVTAGPGMTNAVTGIAGAYLESREVLVIGGQVKVSDLARDEVRQRGIQEIDGVAIAKPITEKSLRLERVVDRATFAEMTVSGSSGRKGPVFLEIPLDLQGARVDASGLETPLRSAAPVMKQLPPDLIGELAAKLRSSKRPVLLLGAGIDRCVSDSMQESLAEFGVPVFLTWNAMDRLGSDHPMYFGRPNTWGQRSANILLQQSDLLLALGTRLSLQQTGFNWQNFAPLAEVVQVDCDPAELAKGHPIVDLKVCGDANEVLRELLSHNAGNHTDWVQFCRFVREQLPLVEENQTGEGYLSPYVFAQQLGQLALDSDIVIPCSSGGAFTTMMQAFSQKLGQRIVSNKGLASMGYGLSGAIGAAVAGKGKRTILVEGDGGFTQNMQELGTVRQNRLNLKIFVFDDHGYASIRMTQRNYFGGRYVGCDIETGLGMPDWTHLFAAYSIPMLRIGPGFASDAEFLKHFDAEGPAAFVVSIDPKQTYFPKITSRVTASGSMESNPLHVMSPDLEPSIAARVLPYLLERE
ncbi:thiamine pyrophosphate-binding protein [Terriglobus albidus]|uniref:Thiamine pyrophosphate-binding protein n=1 Tax=Terriglobus albidus TaxID=1592106 RepID=A0A5B9EBA0_9BACT|nr:thiamine pyrophosphate-binding protein [Terriglobus albidus]QEE27960.1 thiamine pyrophosphate-binding protein [Terriglobus albidus]